MNIVHLGKYYPPVPGGIETFVGDLAREQRRRGHIVTVLAHQHRPGLPGTRTLEAGVTVIRARILAELACAPLSPVFPFLLSRELRRLRPDLLHVHLPNVSALSCLLWRRLPPLVLHWHADIGTTRTPAVARLSPLYRLAERLLLARAAAVIVTSPPALTACPALVPVAYKCRVIPLGLDFRRIVPSDAASAGESPRVPADARPMVLSAGRFTTYKGMEIIAQAATRRPQVLELVRRLGLEDRVFLPGYVDASTLADLYRRCALFCLASTEAAEAFGLVQLEAMAWGRAIVSTRLEGSGVSWVNEHGRTGLVVPPGDPEALAKALGELLGDAQRRQAMGLAGQAKFAASFRIEHVAESLDALYAEHVR